LRFYGSSNSWGSYSGFNYSNITDDTSQSYTNDKSAITGSGFGNSDNYGMAFVPLDYMGPNPTVTIPVGAALTGNAAGHPVAGAYFTNSTYAYYYMADTSFRNAHHWLQLVIRGYLNGQQNPDSVTFMLADFRDSAQVLVQDWEWVNLLPLGNADSLTFDLLSDDNGSFGINVPAYFAVDNIITFEDDGPCAPPANILASNISDHSAGIAWTGSTDTATAYYYVLDQQASLAPDTINPAAPPVLSTHDTELNLTGLVANTTYYFHIREVCPLSGGFAYHPWDTVSFTTLQTNSITDVAGNGLHFRISPNPAREQLTITAKSALDVRIYDLRGKMLLQKKATREINISALAPGIYLLKATNQQGNQSGIARFIKK
jgi:hypothetical protein